MLVRVSQTINQSEGQMVASLTERLVGLIREKQISDVDLHQTALLTLDAVANMIAGRNSVPGRKLLR